MIIVFEKLLEGILPDEYEKLNEGALPALLTVPDLKEDSVQKIDKLKILTQKAIGSDILG